MSPANIVSFWGDPRGGGSRSHRGNDIAGGYRQTVYAIVSGTWDIQSYGNNAGYWAILKGDDGNSYWYLHLDAHAVGDGARVSKGQHVAYNGWTGNAVGTVYHIHFEVHPGGGGAVDPYPYLRDIC
jgi:murein DD-endopeptidase MepM/ murein hydrolase activator NlpD